MKYEAVIAVNGRIFKGYVDVTVVGDDEVVIDGAAEYRLDADPEREGNRILEDYQILGWEK